MLPNCPGTLLNMVGLILLGCSNTHDFNGLPAGAVILGLAGITFHLSQLHISNLFPRSRGFISSLLVAGFTGCGVIFYLLDLIFVAAGGTRSAFLSTPLRKDHGHSCGIVWGQSKAPSDWCAASSWGVSKHFGIVGLQVSMNRLHGQSVVSTFFMVLHTTYGFTFLKGVDVCVWM